MALSYTLKTALLCPLSDQTFVIYPNEKMYPCATSLQGPPVITIEPAETVIEAGATAMLNCQAKGEPPPTITWSRQGHPVVSEERVTVLSNGSLRIVAARKEDTSEYECVARNLMGSVLVRVPLIVQGRCTKYRTVTVKLLDSSINSV